MHTMQHRFSLETLKKLRESETPIVIFGAGIVGEALFIALQKLGVTVQYFCDNNVNKTKVTLRNLDVLPPLKLREEIPKAAVFISIADIGDAVRQLENMGYSTWFPATLLLKDFQFLQSEFSVPADFVEYAVATCLHCQESYFNPEKIFLRSVDIIITERCSLKCQDCSNLMQYYKEPRDLKTEALLHSIDSFCKIVDAINEFRVIGGEPFMNKDCHLIIKRLIDEPKVNKIVIYTNGTIIPNDLQMAVLKHKKVLFIITDYGVLSKKIGDLTARLQQENIVFYSPKARGWTDCSKINKHLRSPEEQKEVFRTCCAKNTFTISDHKLYRCPFAANANRLQALPDFPADSVPFGLVNENEETISEIQKKIRKFLSETTFLESCDFCNGRSFDAPEIQPAIQSAKPLPYGKVTP